MANADLLKGGVIVVLLLAALAGFDALNGLQGSWLGSVTHITGAAVFTIGEPPDGEVCPASIDLEFDKQNYKISDSFSYSVTTRDANGNPVTSELDSSVKIEGEAIVTLGELSTSPSGTYKAEGVVSAATTLGTYTITVKSKDFCANPVSVTKIIVIAPLGQTACADSDGGKDYYEKGVTSKTGRGSYEDKCVVPQAISQEGYYVGKGGKYYKEASDCSGSDCYVAESYCDSTTSQFNPDEFFNLYSCPNGCEDGACLPIVQTPADCSEGEKAVIRQGETRRYLGPEGREYDIYAKAVGSMTAELRMTTVPKVSTEATVVGEVNLHELGEFTFHKVAGETILIKTFTTVVDRQPYGMQFCLQKETDVTAGATEVTVQQGWNMIAVPTFTYLASTTCSKDDGSASTGLYDVVQIWNYSSTTPYYDNFRLSDKLTALTWITDQPVGGPRHTSAGWVYNYGPSCSITAAIPGIARRETFTGWAQVAVQPSWEGKTLSGLIQPNCDFGGGWFYDNQPSGANWERIESNTKFEQKHTGKGFWAYSSKWCTIG